MLTKRRPPTKSSVYIQKLDDARCHGRWAELPELARKVEKHAPERKCLALVARSEAQVANFSHNQKPTNGSPSISSLTKPLLEAGAETSHPEDAFQAQVCVAWIHWMLNDSQAVIEALPGDLASGTSNLATGDMEWTKVCIVKSAYLKGFAQETRLDSAIAHATYTGIIPFLQAIDNLSGTNSQLHLWAERLLTRMCMVLTNNPLNTTSLAQGLQIFRLWDALWNPEPSDISSYKNLAKVDTDYTRHDVWRFSYRFLSVVIQKGLVFSPDAAFFVDAADLEDSQLAETRLQLRTMLKRVEATCESHLLKETTFPKASEDNEEMDGWTDEVVANWRVMCGPSWDDAQLGEGGKAALSRGILDILYRAASKTFHSVKVLRHLFVVHASLAEFELAFKAFDSYVDIVNRARDRAERTGELDKGLDDNNTVIRTASEAIRILCRYGSFKEAERAYEIGNTILRWLKQRTPSIQEDNASRDETQSITETLLTPRTLAIAYRAIGLCRAHWARTTYDASARPSLQAEAITALRRALDHEQDSTSLETIYSLALVLAESRDIPGAIKVVKRGLAPAGSSQESSMQMDQMAASTTSLLTRNLYYNRERKQVALWHLLALLLTARSDHGMAIKACDAAFDQFGDIQNLLGSPERQPFKSEHLNEKLDHEYNGLVDRMDSAEKERLLEVKLTQMTLTEMVDGTSAAMDSSSELLALYARLFGDPKLMQPKLAPSTAVPPKTGATIKGSIFGRSRSVRNASLEKDVRSASATSSGRPSTTVTTMGAPTIHVTDEAASNGTAPSPRPDRPRTSPGNSNRSALQQRSLGSVSKSGNESAPEGSRASVRDEKRSASERRSRSERRSMSTRPSIDSSRIPPFPASLQATLLPLIGTGSNSNKRDSRLIEPLPPMGEASPSPKFPSLHERKHRISVLIGVWLFISGLYRRAEYYEDAKGAIDEAQQLLEGLENELTQLDGSWRALGDKGWGDSKSIEELWGDVLAERAELAATEGKVHTALATYEKALQHFPDHPGAIIGLSHILLDIYTEKVPAEKGASATKQPISQPRHEFAESSTYDYDSPSTPKQAKEDLSPEQLNRIAARDRAYGLLSSLTKLGAGWDDAEAWFTLAEAYEEGEQEAKARECLWWVVELEDARPIRHWRKIGGGGGVL